MTADFSQIRPVNSLALLEQGMSLRREHDTRRALSEYAVSPNAEALARLSAVSPETGMAIQQRDRAYELQQGTQQLQMQKFEQDQQQDRVKQRNSLAGNYLVQIAALPAEQRPAAWDQFAQKLASEGFPEAAQYVGQYSEDTLRAAAAQFGVGEKIVEIQQPKYIAVGEGGVVNVRDPNALAQVAGGQPQAAAAGGPAPGTVVGGYRYQGGNPKDRASWVPAQGGASPQGGATFP